MIIIGIDFSINYPAICISKDYEEFHFVGIVNNPRLPVVERSFLVECEEKTVDLSIVLMDRNNYPRSKYHLIERDKIIMYMGLVSKIITEIHKHSYGDDHVIVAIEGMAYGARGSSLIDIAMATGILRNRLVTEILSNEVENLFVFAPGELKNSIGAKGNAKKDQIFNNFISDPLIPAVKDSDFYSLLVDLSKNSRVVKENGEIASPWNDIIDAYLSVLKLSTFHEPSTHDTIVERYRNVFLKK